ncbi:MAG: NADH-quinone oxidoreductase subunit L [Bdellovibrio sp.]|nr:MAG: NADH-quinone oxidoreductase subunit L [Bdellovibrio sp.]
MSEQLLFVILLFSPLVGFIINGLRFQSKNYRLSGGLASFCVFLSFLASVFLVIKLAALPGSQRVLSASLFPWIEVGSLSSYFRFVVDPISSIMILVITGVGTLIHIFSIGYMSHDERPTKYFAYLNFFVFNMLLLVLGDNLLVMFTGWEGVGLCSYLLIGFWFTDEQKAAAGMKAFITNRIGDAGFLLGIFLIYSTFGTLQFSSLIETLPSVSEMGWTGPITLSCLFLFIGATGKSAQIPLYVWLPDAMAGPTPVSALIHAATMVTAGVYMIVRLGDFFMLAPYAMAVIALIGALTAFFAATIGITQWDIKKVLAYSTVSQLGYMFLAVGVGAFGAAMFHLMTHAFFKALMFLGSGSVIHAMNDEQDIRKMGGLKKSMPITYWTFVCGWLAIIGAPGFSGFFSKDEILWNAFQSPMGSKGLWLIGVLGAVLTAFYMTRLMALVFWGKSRVPKDIHPHESPLSMTFPLVVLGVLSVIGGWVGVPHVIGGLLGHMPNYLEHWLSFSFQNKIELPEASASLEWMLMTGSTLLVFLSAYVAYDFYVRNPSRPQLIAAKAGEFYTWVYNKYFVDEFYNAKIIQPTVKLGKGLWEYIDVSFIDRITYWVSAWVLHMGRAFRYLQNGNAQVYALYISLGVVGTVICAMLAGM